MQFEAMAASDDKAKEYCSRVLKARLQASPCRAKIDWNVITDFFVRRYHFYQDYLFMSKPLEHQSAW